MRRPCLGVLGCLVGVGLIVSGVSPVWAAEGGASDGSALVGGFGLGDGLEGSIDEPSGAFELALPAGGLNLGWDSRAMGSNPLGLGEGWGFGLARIQVDGGVRVFPASGGSYPADASSPTGLGGYTLADTRFEQTPGVLPAERAHPEVPYAYALHELGGSSTYFTDTGDPIAHVNGSGSRTYWVWEPEHRLVEVIDADGVSTSLTWSSSTLMVRPGANLPGEKDAWVVELKNDRVVAAVDPEGGRTQVDSDPSGLVMRVTGESGARTVIEWRAHDDGVARVDRVATFGADEAELSSRSWQPAGAGTLSSGWPAVDAGMSVQGVGFATKVGDGQSELESTYNAMGSLVSRVMSGSTSSGRQVLQEQSFEYPGTDEHGVPTAPVTELPKQWVNPSAATVTFRDAMGGERSGTQRSEFDEFGRLVKRMVADAAGSYSGGAQTLDAIGRTTRDVEGTTYTYDADNRVTGHTTSAGVITQVRYWADGSRRSLTINEGEQEVSTGFYWDGDTLLNDTHAIPGVEAEAPVTASYLIGVIRHARTLTTSTGDAPQVQGTSYLGTDRHGNTTDVTDERGTVTTRYDYTDYGTTTITPAVGPTQATGAAASAERNPFQYASAYADPAGTLHLDVRDYRPGTMRFDTPDVAKELTNYAYGDLNPITNVDPSGRSAIGDQLINGALVVWGLVAGIAAGLALGLPTGGMSVAATAWYVTAAVAIAGDLASVGMAVAQIIDTAGPRFIRDADREGLRVSNIVLGTVAGFVSGAATYMYRARRAADTAALPILNADGTTTLPVTVRTPPIPKGTFEGKKTVEDVMAKLSRRVDQHLAGIERSVSGVRDLDGFSALMLKPRAWEKSKVIGSSRPLAPVPKTLKLKKDDDWFNFWRSFWVQQGGAVDGALTKMKNHALRETGNGDPAYHEIHTAVTRIRKDIGDAKSYIDRLRHDAAEQARIVAQRETLKALLE